MLLISSLMPVKGGWQTDFEKARQEATAGNKYILLNFSGSDWCGPCIKLHDEVFESDAFKAFADDNLVLVNADFPRLKKNQLDKTLQKQNEKLADRYNQKGIFPETVLLKADGSVVKIWEGNPGIDAPAFVRSIKTAMDGSR